MRPPLARRLSGFGTTIFTEMTRLAIEHDAVNLAQGFPDFDGPEFAKEAAIAAIRSGRNQYARMTGIPDLHAALAVRYRRDYALDYAEGEEWTVTSGATEAIFAAISGTCGPGDEVILFEPYYDSYKASVRMAGARPRIVTLHAPAWRFDPAELEAAFGPKTRAILVNTPHNPTGRVFSREELEAIARLCIERDVLCITDEVYEHLVYDDGRHIPMATLPGMRERTITISSFGKTFSLTGWKIGWAGAPAPLTAAVRAAHQFITFATATPFQYAAAVALTEGEPYFRMLRDSYQKRRDYLVSELARIGFGVSSPGGTYFVCADIRPLGYKDDVRFCRMLTKDYGVAAIPPSVFFDHKKLGKHWARFAFCKKEETLETAVARLGEAGEVTLRVALLQMDMAWEDVAENHRRAAKLLARAADAGAKLALLPEMFSTGFSMEPERVAEEPGGISERYLVAQARAFGLSILASVPQKDPAAPLPQNVALLASPAGGVTRYAKIHPFTFGGENKHYAGGDRVVTAEVEGVRVTPFVCYDLRFPEPFRLAARDTDLFAVVANWPSTRRAHWRLLLRARAIENQAYVIGVNRAGSGGGLNYGGDSAAIGPMGETLVEARESDGETVLTCDIDPKAVEGAREKFPVLDDIRPEAYRR